MTVSDHGKNGSYYRGMLRYSPHTKVWKLTFLETEF